MKKGNVLNVVNPSEYQPSTNEEILDNSKEEAKIESIPSDSKVK